ncbi:DUF2306 domain-containing protein [Hamadaea tsunoensis]|uniref:DUF2306 domain-containing protein n=1 Tax=Hamadaea tsunoensis TaxID=53368 RepID=UPI0004109451|nr:DUF2306 domain-containing protein [Hamadaea tsunoensis]
MTRPTSTTRRQWLIPAGLVLFSLVPMAGGAVRVASLVSGAEVTRENARFFDAPVPVLVHIFGAAVFALLGAFQFVPGLRRGGRGWHRVAGRVTVVAGLAVGLSGLWMTVFYPDAPGDGLPVRVIRLFVSVGMLVSIVLAFLAIRRREVRTHRAWMMRGYALAMGAGTQVFTHVPYALLVGVPTHNVRAVLMAAGWVINIAFVEWILRRPRARHLVPA